MHTYSTFLRMHLNAIKRYTIFHPNFITNTLCRSVARFPDSQRNYCSRHFTAVDAGSGKSVPGNRRRGKSHVDNTVLYIIRKVCISTPISWIQIILWLFSAPFTLLEYRLNIITFLPISSFNSSLCVGYYCILIYKVSFLPTCNRSCWKLHDLSAVGYNT